MKYKDYLAFQNNQIIFNFFKYFTDFLTWASLAFKARN